MVFENMRKELSELVGLVRMSERYCTSVAVRPIWPPMNRTRPR
jgi:hypothetical protein